MKSLGDAIRLPNRLIEQLEKKVRVALDWLLDLIFSKDLVQFQIARVPHVSELEERPAVGRVAAPS